MFFFCYSAPKSCDNLNFFLWIKQSRLLPSSGWLAKYNNGLPVLTLMAFEWEYFRLIVPGVEVFPMAHYCQQTKCDLVRWLNEMIRHMENIFLFSNVFLITIISNGKMIIIFIIIIIINNYNINLQVIGRPRNELSAFGKEKKRTKKKLNELRVLMPANIDD